MVIDAPFAPPAIGVAARNDERRTITEMYKSAFDLSDMSDAMDFGTGGSMVPRCVTDLKPCVYDAPLRGSGA
jgi:hypothetical protein